MELFLLRYLLLCKTCCVTMLYEEIIKNLVDNQFLLKNVITHIINQLNKRWKTRTSWMNIDKLHNHKFLCFISQ